MARATASILGLAEVPRCGTSRDLVVVLGRRRASGSARRSSRWHEGRPQGPDQRAVFPHGESQSLFWEATWQGCPMQSSVNAGDPFGLDVPNSSRANSVHPGEVVHRSEASLTTDLNDLLCPDLSNVDDAHEVAVRRRVYVDAARLLSGLGRNHRLLGYRHDPLGWRCRRCLSG